MVTSYTYDDFGLIPRIKSTLKSRKDVSLQFKTKKFELEVPIIGAPMDTVCGWEMCLELHKIGAIGIIHRFNTIETEKELLIKTMTEIIKYDKSYNKKIANVGIAIGINGDYKERLNELLKAFDEINNSCSQKFKLWICFDTANGFSQLMEEALNWFYSWVYDKKKMIVIAGNIASYEGYKFLDKFGVDLVRIGIGGGSVCSTSIATGVGAGSVSILKEISKHKKSHNALLIADGGIKSSGDAVKAFWFGADAIMLGRLLAGHEECPGNIIEDESGIKYKSYYGLSSNTAIEKIKKTQNVNKYKSPEGIETKIKLKGNVFSFLNEFIFGIKSAFSYINSYNLNDFYNYRKKYPNSMYLLSNSAKIERQPKY